MPLSKGHYETFISVNGILSWRQSLNPKPVIYAHGGGGGKRSLNSKVPLALVSGHLRGWQVSLLAC